MYQEYCGSSGASPVRVDSFTSGTGGSPISASGYQVESDFIKHALDDLRLIIRSFTLRGDFPRR